MALKKPGRKIKIPKRRFLGPSPQVDKIVSDIINNEFEKYIKRLK
jgi:phage gpG-like protein